MILANPFKREAEALLKPYLGACERVLRSGWYILGQEVSAFENELARYLGVEVVVGCASGLDALMLSLAALGVGPGDEVITTPLTAAATALAITHLGAKPVFADVLPDTLGLDPSAAERVITAKTKAIIPVHLYGFPAPVGEFKRLCDREGLALIEDCAQSVGARAASSDAMTGSVGYTGCFSFYPTKNLGAFGDAGAISTRDPKVAERLRKLRNYGQRGRYDHELAGYNSRLDELHAAFLREKLHHLDEWTSRRQAIAGAYDRALTGTPIWRLPKVPKGANCVYHLYPIQVADRDGAVDRMKGAGIEALVHYPTLVPEQECYRGDYPPAREAYPVAYEASRRLLSLPINPYLDDAEVDQVASFVVQQLGR